MESTAGNFQNETQTPQRPQFLTVLCILSFIWSGLAMLAFILAMIFSGTIFEMLQRISDGDQSFSSSNMQVEDIDKFLEMGRSMFTMMMGLCLLFVGISLFGVIKMWNLRKSGFYIYSIANGIGIVFGLLSGSFVSVLFSVAFIVMYGLNLKHMK